LSTKINKEWAKEKENLSEYMTCPQKSVQMLSYTLDSNRLHGRQAMKKKGFTPEQVTTMLREAEVLIPPGATAAEVVRTFGTAEQTYYRRKRGYNTIGPHHSAIGYKPPAPEAVMPTTGYSHMVGSLTLRVVQ
jgi:hypothetical protein